ncbi:MAG: AAA-like domain-containing protein [Acidobacteriota bacterium]
MKFFVSYRRRETEDADLAAFLVEGLGKRNHEVFIDTGMRTGTNWVEEIDRRISWCDFLVVLLSESSVDSEMVQGEVRRAHHRFKSQGSPRILPIRVRYFGSLDYELDSYLARIQYAAWDGGASSSTVLEHILAAAEGDEAPPGEDRSERELEDAARHLEASRDPRRPRPAVDPRAHVLSDQALPVSDPFYRARMIDSKVSVAASLPGQTLMIKAPHQMGKSSLLIRYLVACRKAGKRKVFIDFALLSDAERKDSQTFIRGIADEIVVQLNLSVPERDISSALKLTSFIQRTVLKAVQEPLVIAFDNVDQILGEPYQRDFFRLLRSWSDSRGLEEETWGRVDLALVISTEPTRLIEGGYSSPFSVATPIEPEVFELALVRSLAHDLGADLSDEDLSQLYDLTGGHPFLTRLALYRLVGPDEMSFVELLDKAAEEDGPFGDHLSAKLFRVNLVEGLREAMVHVICNRTRPADDLYHKLRSSGLVRLQDGRVVPANLLYTRFFKQLSR